MAKRRVTLISDPKFPGGTASAIADEIPVLTLSHHLRFVALKTKMFQYRPVNERLRASLDSAAIRIEWDTPLVQSDVIVIHNPAMLKFEQEINLRLAADTCIVVTHENLLAPPNLADAPPTFDAAPALEMIDAALLARQRILAPVSAYNRRTVADWLDGPGAESGARADWQIAPALWPNICAPDLVAPTNAPADRRGRHSRPGNEKFPRRADMERLFPPHAAANVILGADGLMEADPPPHWELHPFGALSLTDFFSKIDFFVYFTNPFWRESFGRVIAEAIGAGKLVIADEGTAEVFGEGVIAATPDEVDGLIARFVANPAEYRAHVEAAQAGLSAFSAEAFAANVAEIFQTVGAS